MKRRLRRASANAEDVAFFSDPLYAFIRAGHGRVAGRGAGEGRPVIGNGAAIPAGRDQASSSGEPQSGLGPAAAAGARIALCHSAGTSSAGNHSRSGSPMGDSILRRPLEEHQPRTSSAVLPGRAFPERAAVCADRPMPRAKQQPVPVRGSKAAMAGLSGPKKKHECSQW